MFNFPFLDGDLPRSSSYGVYISQLICLARVCSNVRDFNNRNQFLTAKLLQKGYKGFKAFSKFYHRHSELSWFKNSSATGHIRVSVLW